MKDACYCTACEEAMPSGTSAVLFQIGTVETHKKGGHDVFIAESWNMYFHIACVSDFIDDVQHEITQEPTVCHYCGWSIGSNSGSNTKVGRFSQYGKVEGDVEEGEEATFVESKTEPIEDIYICRSCILDKMCLLEEVSMYMEEDE